MMSTAILSHLSGVNTYIPSGREAMSIREQIETIWISLPDCEIPAAEIWVNEQRLLMTVFVDPSTQMIMVEFPPVVSDTSPCKLHGEDVEATFSRIIRELTLIKSKMSQP